VSTLNFKAEIAEIHLAEQGAKGAVWRVALSRTEFGEGATGTLTAVSASGRELVMEVQRVRLGSDGRVWHEVGKPVAVGTRVTGRVVSGAD